MKTNDFDSNYINKLLYNMINDRVWTLEECKEYADTKRNNNLNKILHESDLYYFILYYNQR